MVRHVLGIVVLVVVLVAGPLAARVSPYFAITPGGAYDVGSRLRIPDERRKEMGRLAFTAVYEQEASWLDVGRAKLLGGAELVPAEQVRPPGTSQQQVNEQNREQIDESKPVAAVVALRAAGFDVRISGQGAQVESLIEGMPAQGVLQRHDIIVGVDGQPIQTTNDLIEAIRRHQVGDTVTLDVVREGEHQQLAVGTKESPSEPGRPVVGVTISTRLFDVQLPFPVDVDSGSVGGPSAGFMFALGILDAVTDGDLTRGYYVAGTGTLAQDGTVGPIGAATEKVMAAEQDGAQVFLVPRDNLADAQKGARSIRVVPISHFEDAVTYLCGLEPLPSAASPVLPPPCQSGR